MKTFGIPYMGSKDKIAVSLIKAMPSGKRFVDLFGGGFSMTECAMKSGKYEYFLYNDYNPLVVNLVMDAINGKYNFKNFKAEWVSRETFERERETDTSNIFGHSEIMDSLIFLEEILKNGNERLMSSSYLEK